MPAILTRKTTMTKNEAIQQVNASLGSNLLNDKNTHWATVVPYGDDEGWWLNIPYLTFRHELHFLLNNEKSRVFRHLKIKAGEILSPGAKFASKNGGAEIFISAAHPKKLADRASGGTKHNFSKYVLREYKY
jgi:hypothetical protein